MKFILIIRSIVPDGPISTVVIAGATIGGVGGVAVMLLLIILLLVVLLWKCHTLKAGKASTAPFTIDSVGFETTEPANGTATESFPMVDNGAYTAIHIETQINEAYQITASVNPNAVYSSPMDNQFDIEENAAYVDRVNNEHVDYEGYTELHY